MADRLIDNLKLNISKPTTERHAFIRSHWRSTVVIWFIIFGAILVFAVLILTRLELIGGLWLAVLINLYFLTLRFSGKLPSLGSIKEILTGTLFSIGVSFFPLLTLPGITLDHVWSQIFFGILCFANVLLISHWEHRIDRAQREQSLTQRTSNSTHLLRIVLINLLGLAIILAVASPGIFSWSFFTSAVGIGALYLHTRGRDPGGIKFLIDVPLMLPLFLLIVL